MVEGPSGIYVKLAISFLLGLTFFIVQTKSEDDRLVNYITTAELPDGEHEIRMRFSDVIVRETSVTERNEKGIRRGLMLRQIASGPHLLQLIHKINEAKTGNKKDHLIECEVMNDWGAANQFRTHFQKELTRSGLTLQVPANHKDISEEDDTSFDFDSEHTESQMADTIDLDQGLEDFRNVTVRMLRNDEVIGDLQRSFDIILQQKQCKRLHRRMKRAAKEKKESESESINGDNKDHSSRRVRRESFRVGIMPGTLWCGDGSLADRYTSMGAHVGTDRCCREHDGCPFMITAMTSSYGVFNYRMHTLSHCTCDERRRQRRGRRAAAKLPAEAFIMPGTEWCGRGSSANSTTQLGGYAGVDSCCRQHDLGCPYYIEAFSEAYGVTNWRMYTLNHCQCDQRFRSCLKQTNTGAANFVGKLFFNVVQTKCFVLKPERSCVKQSWWGKCLRYEYKKQAYLREPLPY